MKKMIAFIAVGILFITVVAFSVPFHDYNPGGWGNDRGTTVMEGKAKGDVPMGDGFGGYIITCVGTEGTCYIINGPNLIINMGGIGTGGIDVHITKL